MKNTCELKYTNFVEWRYDMFYNKRKAKAGWQGCNILTRWTEMMVMKSYGWWSYKIFWGRAENFDFLGSVTKPLPMSWLSLL